MSKSYRPPIDPSEFTAEGSDDEHEIIDVDYETIVYDDVDGHVIEAGAALPAPPVRLDDDDDDRASTAIVPLSAGDTMPFAIALDDLLTHEDALLDRAVAARPPADRVPLADRVDETPLAAVTSHAMAAAVDARRAPAGPTSTSPPPTVERTEAPRMPADRRPATAPVAVKPSASVTTSTVDEPSPASARGVVCPFCAHVRADADAPCPRCTMADTASTRRSTGERIGPWFVLQRKNPTAPGLRFSVLLKLARRGHVTAKSIVRGPTTGQLWRYAGEVKGLSRVFGTCWHCRADLSPDATTCPKCKSAQDIPDDPDVFLESQAVPLMTDATTPAEPPIGVIMREVLAPVDEPAPRRVPPSRPAAAVAKPAPAPKVDRPAVVEPKPPARIAASVGAKSTDPVLSASELAAVFQLAPTVKPGRTRRVGRRLWKVTKVVVVLAVLATAAGVTTFYLKPEWRDPARDWATPIALDARDRALAAKDWTTQKSTDAWHATADAIARWRTPPAPTPAPTDPPAAPSVADNDSSIPVPTPIHADDATPSPSPSPVAKATPTVAEGQSSIVDVTPPKPVDRSAADRARIAAQLDADQQTWDSLMAARAATKPVDAARAGAADANGGQANGGQANTGASVGANSAAAASVDADERVAALARATNAAIADAERALAQSKANATPAPAVATPSPVPPQPSAPQSTAAPQQPVQPRVSLDDAMSRAVTLRQKAFDAQARGDWPGAVAIYQEIAKLPAEAQPSDLQVRLKLAQDRAKR